MHRLTNAIGSVSRPLASKALQRTFSTSPVKTQKQGGRFYSTPAASVVAEPFLNGTSSTYVEEMYESWLENPNSVHKSWDIFFRNARDGAPPGSAYISPPAIRPSTQLPGVGARSVAMATVPAAGFMPSAIPDTKLIDDHLAVQAIIRAYQVRGHNVAELDPLGIYEADLDPSDVPELLPHTYALVMEQLKDRKSTRLNSSH